MLSVGQVDRERCEQETSTSINWEGFKSDIPTTKTKIVDSDILDDAVGGSKAKGARWRNKLVNPYRWR